MKEFFNELKMVVILGCAIVFISSACNVGDTFIRFFYCCIGCWFIVLYRK
jgi:hypothetical protein